MLEHADAFIYGYLIGLNISLPYIYTAGFSGGRTSSSDNAYGYGATPEIPQLGWGGGENGQTGCPFYASDDPGKYNDNNVQSAGAGGEQSQGGKGLRVGTFGFGGNGYGFNSGQILGGGSCGGGGGWFGGGSAWLLEGGGGGSGYIRYGKKVSFKQGEHTGDGLCVIKKVNDDGSTIELDRFEYTGKVQEFTALSGITYRISCYGAQGGGFYWDEVNEKYGGLGGTTIADFEFSEAKTLYIYVGQKGSLSSKERPYNGGGCGTGGNGDGGGATDVRLKTPEQAGGIEESLLTRIIVGGGGGGCPKSADIPSNSDRDLGWDSDTDTYKDQNPESENHSGYTWTIDLGYVAINDLSDLYLHIYHVATEEEDVNPYFSVIVNVDNKTRFTRKINMVKGRGSIDEEFLFSNYLADLTPLDYKRVIIYITASDTVMIPKGGMKAWIDTPLRYIDNNSGLTEYNKPLLNIQTERIKIGDLVVLETIERPEDQNIKESDKYYYKDNIVLETVEPSPDGDISIIGLDKTIYDDDVIIEIKAIESNNIKESDKFYTVDATVIELRDTEHKDKSDIEAFDFGDNTVITIIDPSKLPIKEKITDSFNFNDSTVIKLEGGNKNPYIEDSLAGSFDSIYNRGLNTSQDLNSKMWINLLSTIPLYDKDYRGFISDSLTDVFDGIDHGDKRAIWINKLTDYPTFTKNTRGYISNDLTNSFDGIDHGDEADQWNNLE